jgi:hypothetical protein
MNVKFSGALTPYLPRRVLRQGDMLWYDSDPLMAFIEAKETNLRVQMDGSTSNVPL